MNKLKAMNQNQKDQRELQLAATHAFQKQDLYQLHEEHALVLLNHQLESIH